MWIYDPHSLRFLDVNGAAVAVYGYSKNEFLAATIDRLAALDSLTANGQNSVVHLTKAGRSIHVELRVNAIQYRGSQAMLAVARDVGEAIETRERLAASEASLALVQQLAHVGTFSFDTRTGRRHWSEEIYRILGMEPDTPALLEGFWSFADTADADRVRSEVLRARFEGRAYSIDYRITRADGSTRTVNERGHFQYDEHGDWFFLSGTLQDITERERAQSEIRHLAYHDSLTDLLNRAGLTARMESHLDLVSTRLTGVVLFDLDRFKTINDTLGHRAGDEVLISVAQRLSQRLSGNEIVARTGGDEFVCVIPECNDRAQILMRADQLLQAFRTPFIVGNYPYTISASAGISIAPFDGTEADELLRCSDVAMYQSKTEGRNRASFFSEALQKVAHRRFDLERGLRRGLDKNEFAMHYQPIICAKTGCVQAVEALLRWHNNDLQPTPPGDFIEFAEETGVIEEIGDRVFETSFAQAKQWAQAGVPLRIWINVSAIQLHAALPGKVRALLDKYGINPASLGFELTESSFITASTETLQVIRELKSLGVRLALDDFGVKYSSLEYLQRLPIDTIKIDRVFVSGVSTNRINRAIIAAIVNIAHEMNFTVSAEGVETREDLETIRQLGCDNWQGFFFSTARPAGEIVGLMGAVEQAV